MLLFCGVLSAQYSFLSNVEKNPYYALIGSQLDLKKPTLQPLADIVSTTKTVETEPAKKSIKVRRDPAVRLPITEAYGDKTPKPFVRKTTRIAADYENFAIVIKESERPLLSTDPIFRRFGKIVYDKTESGRYVYMIRTPFKSKKSVDAFLEAVLQPHFPGAYTVEYRKGMLHIK